MFDLKTDRIESHNVVARLPGATHPDETVLYTAHWDHIGVGDARRQRRRHLQRRGRQRLGHLGPAGDRPGLRRGAAHPALDRGMISFTGEESGLLGSEYYAANPLYPLAKTVGGFNMDSANVYGRTTAMSIIGFGQSDFDERVTAAVEAQGRAIEPDANTQAGYYFRSDHFPLAKEGVPMAYAESGGTFRDEPVEARIAARDEYTEKRYHQADDEWSPTGTIAVRWKT
jgi:Zn-dependent M28 family amino/carboxypeptidase